MSQNNITENLFGAIDVIIAQKIKGLQFDLTKICTITDNNKAQNGAYTVTDGSITFEAYSENKTYKVGDAVRVSVPNADFTDKKYIIGKYITDNSITPITYVSPLESILDITTNLVPESKRGPHHLYANEQVSENATIEDLMENSKGTLIATIRPNIESLEISEIYDTFYIAGEFRTLLGDYTILTGNYGIRAEFHDGDQVHELYLDSQDMFGDPYNFAVFTSQQQTYNIEKIKKIDEISLYFYQFNNFSYDKNGEPAVLPCYKTLPANLELTNLAIGFGTMLSNMDDNTAKIYTNSSKEYKQNSSSSCEKKINLLWYNKNEFGKYLGFDDGEFYDEFKEYIEPKAYDRALLKYSGDDAVPHDIRGLEIADALEKFNTIIDNVVKYTDEVILPEINNFKIQTKGTIDDVELQYAAIRDLKTSIIDTQKRANDYIKQTLAAAAWQYNPTSLTEDEKIGKGEEYPTLIEFNYVAEVSYACDKIYVTLNTMLDYTLENSYIGVYDNFKIKVQKMQLEIPNNSNFAKLNSIISNKNVNAYQSGDYIFEFYEGNSELEKLSNRYSIYWYRYDPNSLLDNTFVSGDSFVSANWKRDTNIINEKYYTFTANADKNTEEHVMAVVFYNHEYYKSNVITFTNSDKVLDDRTENLTASIALVNGDKSKEAYQLYGSSNSLLNQSEAYQDREVIVQFMENDTTVNNSKLDNCQIYWYLPNNSTMLAPSTKNTQAITFDGTADDDQSEYALENYTCYYQPATTEKTNRSFYYRIKDYYVQSATQNHIKCKVVTPDKYSYDTTIYFGFSSFGTSGTDYTLFVTPQGGQSAVLYEADKKLSKPLKLKVTLYDYNNNTITPSALQISDNLDNYTVKLDGDIITVEKKATQEKEKYYGVIAITATVNNTQLQTFYPIACATDNYFIEGTTTVIYNSFGNSPHYYKDPYKIYGLDKNISWALDDEAYDPPPGKTEKDNPNISILPTIENDIFKPCVMYVEGVDIRPVAKCSDYYYQSIYIGQNRYPSPMLNSWDNSLTIDKNNGTILSQVVGAGRTTNQKFSGILMGEIDKVSNEDNHSGYGLYGFHEGAQSFGFNVDGTAFLGKSGRGRIFFDGNSGTIESASYQSLNGSAGMKIDLDDGFIHMRGAEKNNDNAYKSTQSDIYLGVMPQKNNSAYFSIDSENGNRLIHIGIDDYYLQTDNFNSNGTNNVDIYDENGNILSDDENSDIFAESSGAGTKIDLKNGKITSYDFTIDAYSNNNHLLLSSSADTYPLSINDTFKVNWNGAMFSTAGVIGNSVVTGQLFISGNQIVTGGAKENHDDDTKSIVYLQKGTSEVLNLNSIGYGTVDNDFYLGSGGLIFKNTNINETDYGMRLTSTGLIVDGANEAWEPDGSNLGTTFDSSAKFSTFYQGYGITFAFKSKDSSILFNNTSIENANFIGFTEDGGLQLLSPRKGILIDAKNITLNASNGEIRLANNNDLYQGNNVQGIFYQVKALDALVQSEMQVRYDTDRRLLERIQLLEKQIEDLAGMIGNNNNNSGSTLPSTPGDGEVTPEIKD